MEPLFEILINSLKEADLIKIIDSNNKEYEWIRPNQIINDLIENHSLNNSISEFIEQVDEFEKIINKIYREVFSDQIENIPAPQMLANLVQNRTLDSNWQTDSLIIKMFNLRNSLAHNKELDDEEKELIKTIKFSIGKYRAELLENYSFTLVANILAPNNFQVSQDYRYNLDIIAIKNQTHILFDIKYFPKPSRNNKRLINDTINRYLNYEISNKTNIHYIFIIFQNTYDLKFEEQFVDVLKQQYPKLEDHFHFQFINISQESIILAYEKFLWDVQNTKYTNNTYDSVETIFRKNDVKPIFSIKGYSTNSEPIRVRLINIGKRAKLTNLSYIDINNFYINSTPSIGSYIDNEKNFSIEIPKPIKTKQPNGEFAVKIEFCDIDDNKYYQILQFHNEKFTIDDPIESK